jgi:Ca2+/H+ antiporter, TMEM165/GDT1 family
MMCCGQERDRSFWIKRAVFIPLAIAAGIFIFGGVVMLLWKWLLPAIFGVGTITFWQALGILLLSKILFSGFKGGHSHYKYHGDGHYWREKWMHLTSEEREKMKAEWKSRCTPPVKEE